MRQLKRTSGQLEARYSVLPSLLKRFDEAGRKLALTAKNQPALRRWKAQLRRKLRELSGYDTIDAAPLRPRITDEVHMDGYCRQRVEITTEPNVVMPMFVLIPDRPERLQTGSRMASVICTHGHGGGGKAAVAGVRDDPAVAKAIALRNYDYGVQFCRAGMIAFCPDARGMGERQEKTALHDVLRQSCEHLNHMAYPLGRTVIGMWTWDLHRLVDYIQSRPDCDPDRIGCAGLSGGGLQTLWAAALDERIRAAVISGYFYGSKEALLEMYRNCSCNYVPRLFQYADMGDIAGLIAPRPLLIETGTRDPLNGASGIGNVVRQVKITRRAYAILGAQRCFVHDIFEDEHRWHGVVAIPFMKRALLVT